jgi:hypothetical protein
MITCFIRYHIDPTKKEQFNQYARNWGQAIPRCGADLIGYFAPHEGSSTLAYGVYNIDVYQPIHWDVKITNLRSGKSSWYAKTGRS